MKKIISSIIIPCVVIGMAGFWIIYFLLGNLEPDFYYKFIARPLLLGIAIASGVASYMIGRRVSSGDWTKRSMATSIMVGLIFTALGFFLWFLFPFLFGM